MATSYDFDDAGVSFGHDDQPSGEAASTVSVAQAETPPSDGQANDPQPVDVGQGVPAQGQAEVPATGAPAAGSVVYTADASNTVRLPANASIENMRIEGNDLVLEQADGTLIIVKDAALNVPTFIIGDVEIPRVALLAAIEANGMDVAFGADGSIAVTAGNPSADSSGGDFDVPPGGIGDGLNFIDLLPPTDLSFGQLEVRELFPPLPEPDEPVTEPVNLFPSLAIDGGSAVDEAALADGTSPASPNETTSGTFTVGEGDGLQALIINGVDVTNGGTIAGTYGTLSITGNPGAGYGWTYTLTDNTIDHPNKNSTGTSEGIFDSFNVVVVDANGDQASGLLNVDILDDGPTVSVAVAPVEGEGQGISLYLEVDETVGSGDRYNTAAGETFEIGINPNTDDVPGALGQVTTSLQGGLESLFTVGGIFGADDAGTLGGAFGFTGIPVQGLATNLSATDGGLITLFLGANGEIIGRDTQGDSVFTIAAVDVGGVHQLQLTLFEAIDHGQDGNFFDAQTFLALAGSGVVGLQYTVTRTDGDGDTATDSATIDLISSRGSGFSFDDDGPAADLTVKAGATVIVDESLGGQNAGETEGGLAGLGQVTVLGSTLFDVSTTAGQDNVGAPTAYSLSVVGVGATGLLSTDGQPITLVDNAGTIEGQYGGGIVAFTVTIDPVTGDVTLTQLQSLQHPTGGPASPDEAVQLATGALEAVLTVTDGDGDIATSTADLGGVIRFEDDAPTADLTVKAGATVIVDESLGGQNAGETEGGLAGLGRVTVLGSSLFDVSTTIGEDDEGATTAYSVSVVGVGATGLLSTDGQPITLVDNAGTIEGQYGGGIVAFTVTIDPVTGDVTLTQLQSLQHPTGGPASPDEAVQLATGALEAVLTVTDGDGDIATSTADLGGVIRFEDDAPTANDDGPVTPAEDTAITFSVVGNDVFGADGVDLATGVAKATDPTKGTIVYNGDGTFTYTPTAGQTGPDSFTYTITDRDGDTSTATVSITLAADSVPSVTSTTDLEVDEDGFPNAADDTVTARVDETNSTESLTDTSGTAVVNFGNDVPANLAASIVLVDTLGLDNQLQTLDGQNVTFVLSGGDLVGTVSGGAVEVIRIAITGAVAGPGAGDVTYSYSTTLSQPVKHATGSVENSALLSGVTFEATDNDGDPVQGTFDVTVVDDVPQANDDGPVTPAEDTAITFSVVGNDVFGADGVDLATGVAKATDPTKGTIVYNGDGTFTYTPTAGQTGPDSFTYTITDRDGDTSTATVSITLAADSVPSVTSTTDLEVDEDGFPNAADDTLTARVDETNSTESLTDTSGTAVVNFGNDVPANLAASIVLVDTLGLDGQLQTLDGQNVTFVLSGGDLVGTVSGGALEVIRIAITGAVAGPGAGDVTYSYSTTLSQPVKHATGSVENSALLSGVTFEATDNDGDPVQGTFDVTVVDDVPQANDDGPVTPAEDTAITFSVVGNDVFGADGVDLATGVAKATDPTKGTIVYNGDGTFTYTPTAGQTGPDSFTYTITDRDGDTSTATVSITLAADSVPSVTSTTDLEVDEDGFPNAADDTLTARVDETNSTESLTDTSGTAVVNFGNDVPANLAASIVLVDTLGLDNQLQTLDGQNVTFVLSGGDLVGTVSGGALEVIRIAITGAVAGPGAGDVTYSYSTTLSQPVKHATGSVENSALLSGVTFEATDNDGDPVQGTFDVTVVDDVPQANDDGPVTPAEDTAITFSVVGNDVFGADGVDLATGVAKATDPTKGTIVYNGDGTFTYTPTAGQTGPDSFTYTITDRDGDTSTATVSITLAADSVPSVTSTTDLEVDEDGFPNAADDTLTARVDETNSTESLTDTSGTAVVNFGNDVPANLAASIVLVDTLGLDNQLQTLDGQNVTFVLSGGDLVGTVSGGAVEVIRIAITGAVAGPGAGDVTYSYSTTLSQPVKHATGSVENSALLSGVTFEATDNDGDPVQGTFDVTVVDDVPQANDDGPVTPAEDTAITFSVVGNDVFGADGVDLATGVAKATDPTKGTIVYNGDGTFTYTPTAGQTGPDSFTYTITDKDGDTSTATVSITLAADSVPSVTSTTDLEVDEDGFPNAADDTLTARVDETNSTESLTDTSGTAVVNFGNDVPANLAASIVLVDTLGLDGQLQTLDGQNVTFVLSGGDLVGTVSGGAVEVIRIAITGAVAGPGAGDVTYSYSTTLSQPVKHATGSVENSALLSGVTFEATDNDGDPVQGTFDVTVVDDVPDVDIVAAVADTTPATDSVAEGGTLNGSWTLNAGADDVGSITVSVTGQPNQTVTLPGGAAAVFALTAGTLTVNADGTWAFVANINLDSTPEPTVSFAIAATDGDGDSDSDSHTITVTDGADATSAGTASLTVEESDLDWTGSTPAGNDETDTSTALSFTTGSDAISLSFAASQTPAVSGLDNLASITWLLDAGDPNGRTLLGQIGGITVITLTLTDDVTATGGGDVATPTVTAVLNDNFPHENAPDADSLTITGLVVNATDTDGEITTGTLDVTVVDDQPDLTGTTNVVVPNETGTYTGYYSVNPGADQPLSYTISGTAPSGLTYTYSNNNTVLLAETSDGTDYFRITVNNDGTYDVELLTARPTTTTNLLITGTKPGSNDFLIESTNGFALFDGLLFSGSNQSLNFTNPNSGSGSNSDQLFVSNNGFSVGANNGFGDNNGFITTFDSNVSGMSFVIDPTGNVATATVSWWVYDNGVLVGTNTGDAVSDTVNLAGNNTTYALSPGVQFDQVVFRFDLSGNDSIRVQDFSSSQQVIPQDQSLDFTITATDTDGDQDSATFGVTLGGGSTTNDTLTGSSGADVMYGASGQDSLQALGGNDILVGGAGGDTLDGGSGFDIADYSDSPAAISVNLRDSDLVTFGAPVPFNSPSNGQIGGGDATGDSLTGIEGVRGSSGNDFIFGNAGANTLYGNGGNDELRGEEGNDTLYGGSGLNTMIGGATGNDTFVIDPSALGELNLVDVITDFVQGQDVLDLSDLFAALGANRPTTDAAADLDVNLTNNGSVTKVFVDADGAGAGGTFVEVASLTGVHATVAILYDDNQPNHTTNVT